MSDEALKLIAGLASVIGLVGTVIGAAIGATVTWPIAVRNRETETQRWYAEFVLGREFDAISNLHNSLLDCYLSLDRAAIDVPIKVSDYQERVQNKLDQANRAIMDSLLYLSNDDQIIMYAALDELRNFALAILYTARGTDHARGEEFSAKNLDSLDRDKVQKALEAALRCLRRILNPDARKHFERLFK